MLPIGINISPIIEEFSILADKSEELSSSVLDKLVESFMFEWESKVNSELKQTRQEYKNSMFAEKIDSRNAVVGLLPSESSLALMIEDGASSFDIKDGFEKSSKKKSKDDGGWYLTIPFRYATTEAIGESMVFSGKLPKEVQKIAKKVSPAAVALQDLPEQYKKIGVNKTSGYKHKSPIYVGLHKRNIASTKNEKRSGYMNFRRVSDNSDENSWQHPGFEAKKFMDRTAADLNIGEVVDSAVDDFLNQL
jgi:hypothetical protein